MQAFIESSTGDRAVGSEFYRHIFEILEWGRRIWSDISKTDRGVVFELSFVRGVKRLYLTALHERLAVDKDAVCDFTKEDLAEQARQLVLETDAHPPVPLEADGYGFLLSFWMYPKGEALSILGWHHMQTAQQAEEADDKLHHFTESASCYIQAAEMFPEDDEYHPYYLKFALEAYWGGGVASRRECLALCNRIRLSIPKMAVFWQTSQIAKIRDEHLAVALEWERKQQGLLEGTVTLDGVIYIDCIKASVKCRNLAGEPNKKNITR